MTIKIITNQMLVDIGIEEDCALCLKPTIEWNTVNDVACCTECASDHNQSDLPTKGEWLDIVDKKQKDHTL